MIWPGLLALKGWSILQVAFICAGICALVAGSLQIFARNMAWRSAEWNNKLRGTPSERSSVWTMSSIFQGTVGIVLGFALLWIASQVGGQKSDSSEQQKTSAVSVRVVRPSMTNP